MGSLSRMSVGAGGRVKSIRDAASGRHPPARWAPLGEAFGPDALVTGSGAPVRGVYRAPLGERGKRPRRPRDRSGRACTRCVQGATRSPHITFNKEAFKEAYKEAYKGASVYTTPMARMN